jgi:hypothetical protein
LRLQEEIERLRATREGGWEDLLARFPDLRRVGEHLATLRFRADVGKSRSYATVGNFGFDDRTVEYATTVVHSNSAVSVKPDEGRLGAGLRKLKDLAGDLEHLLDPEGQSARKDTRITCGEKGCPGQWRKQQFGSFFCRWCGRDLSEPASSGYAAKGRPPGAPKKTRPVMVEPPAKVEPDPEPVAKPEPEPIDDQESSLSPVNAPLTLKSALNGHRFIVVTAASKEDAVIVGLDEAKRVFSDLDVRAVTEATPLPGSRWKVTVKVG